MRPVIRERLREEKDTVQKEMGKEKMAEQSVQRTEGLTQQDFGLGVLPFTRGRIREIQDRRKVRL